SSPGSGQPQDPVLTLVAKPSNPEIVIFSSANLATQGSDVNREEVIKEKVINANKTSKSTTPGRFKPISRTTKHVTRKPSTTPKSSTMLISNSKKPTTSVKPLVTTKVCTVPSSELVKTFIKGLLLYHRM